MDIEEAFKIVGTCKRYQLLLVFLLFLANVSLLNLYFYVFEATVVYKFKI